MRPRPLLRVLKDVFESDLAADLVRELAMALRREIAEIKPGLLGRIRRRSLVRRIRRVAKRNPSRARRLRRRLHDMGGCEKVLSGLEV